MRPTHKPPPPEVREQIRRNRPLVRLLRQLNRIMPKEDSPDYEREKAEFEASLGRRVFSDDEA